MRLAIAALLLAAVALAWRTTALGDFIRPSVWAAWIEPYRAHPLAVLAVVACFVTGSLVMVPFTAMVAATLWGFGPWLGPAYVLTAAVCSSLVGYELGRVLGAKRFRRMAGPRAEKLGPMLARKSLWVVALIRNLPIAPFSVVNLAAGAARLPRSAFAAGTLLGLVPGTLTLAWLGHLVGLVR